MLQYEKLKAYENGNLDEDDTIALFQELVDSGLAWQLQGTYGRTADVLIKLGYVKMPDLTSVPVK